jgi:hypothetical protein
MDGKAAEEAEAEEAFGMSATPNAPDFLKHSATRVVQKSSPGAERLRERHKGHFSNSTNSLFIADTPTAPNHKLLLRAAAQAVLALVQEDKSAEHSLFDERAHPLSSDKLGVLPSADDVYTFMKNLYTRTRMQVHRNLGAEKFCCSLKV